jgi:phage terminase Nu1 subunit (DNA packaging protein)
MKYAWDDTADEFEGDGADTVPVRGLTKAELATATGLAPKTIGKLVREGCPVTNGRFDLPTLVQWMVERIENPPEADALVKAREAKVKAETLALEMKTKKAAGQLVDIDQVRSDVVRSVAQMRQDFLDVPERLTAQTVEVRNAVRVEILGAFERFNERLREKGIVDDFG